MVLSIWGIPSKFASEINPELGLRMGALKYNAYNEVSTRNIMFVPNAVSFFCAFRALVVRKRLTYQKSAKQ